MNPLHRPTSLHLSRLFRLTVALCIGFLAFLPVACNSFSILPTSVPTAEEPRSASTTGGTAAGAASPAATTPITVGTPTVPPPTPSATPAPILVTAGPGVPGDVVARAREIVGQNSGRFAWAADGTGDVNLRIGGGRPLATWTYAVVVPFATTDDGTTLAQLQANWQAGGVPSAMVTEQVEALLAALWGPGQARIVPPESLVAQMWQERPAWSLVPFQRLTPDLKVLDVDGISPLDRGFNEALYPLSVQVGVAGDAEAVNAWLELWPGLLSNRQADRITEVAMTGVTALVRATAYQMEIRGISYPGEEVAPVLQAADFAHVSNEVSFVPDCPPPHYIGDPVFCSDPRYIALLQEIGVDVVELTGNHLNDWGTQYLPYTLGLYEEAGMAYFGGGRDLATAEQPLLLEHNGNTIAFLGCNPVGPAGAWATAERAGALPCDFPSFRAKLQELHELGYAVIATQQYQEIYNYSPTGQQRADFRALAAAGADAVSGSQGHHAQGFDFHDGAYIHFGLGNLFFDQMDMPGTRQTFVDRYTIYENRLLSVRLWTGLIENYARPRLMTQEERAALLQTVFSASGW